MGAPLGICGPPIATPESEGFNDHLKVGPAYPNPASSPVTVPVTGADGEIVVLRVFDGAGRLVRTIESVVIAGVVHWDRRDGRRRPVESGVYFLELCRGDGAVTTRQRVHMLQ
jgi:hypothetical protein